MLYQFAWTFVIVATFVHSGAADTPSDANLAIAQEEGSCQSGDAECAVSFRQLRAALEPDAHVDDGSETEASIAQALAGRRKPVFHDENETEASLTALSSSTSGKQQILTGYHQTSTEFCELILKNGFRPGHQGWCGGAIYFAMDQRATYTKAIGKDSHLGCMLKAKINAGRAKTMGYHCDTQLNGAVLKSWGFDSVVFNPGDGQEIVVYDPSRIISIEKVWSKGNLPPPPSKWNNYTR